MKTNLSENIRIIRQNKGYWQEYIAYQLKISQQAYSLIENNAEKTSLLTLLKISKILENNPEKNVPILDGEKL